MNSTNERIENYQEGLINAMHEAIINSTCTTTTNWHISNLAS